MRAPRSGLMMLAVSAVMMAVNAVPMMTATARSITLPRRMKSRNPLSIEISLTEWSGHSEGAEQNTTTEVLTLRIRMTPQGLTGASISQSTRQTHGTNTV